MQSYVPNPVGNLIRNARQAYSQGDFQRTITICDGLLGRIGPRHENGPDLLNLKAISLINLGRLEEAGAALRKALKARPAMAGAQANAARVSAGLGRKQEARRHAAEACRLAPREPAVLYNAAQVLRDCGDQERSMRVTGRILEIEPTHANAWHLKASLEIDSGDLEAAVVSLEKTTALAPADANALATLVKLRRYTLADEDIVQRLEAIRSSGLPPRDRSPALFALADINRREGRYHEAFKLYRKANGLSLPAGAFDPDQYDRGVDATIEMTGQGEEHASQLDPTGERLVFIIGMPRSGTSLVEQIVSSHSDVLGAGELDTMEQIERDLQKSGFIPFVSAGPQSPDARSLAMGRERYLKSLPAGQEKFRRVTDKAPMNFQRVAMIHNLFPGARFLYCVRYPLDTILSCFFHDFRNGMEFTFRLEHLTRVYAAHVRLMRHWRSLFGSSIHAVSYPELVGDLEGSARSMAEFLGIGFEPAMLEPHLNRRLVSTASSIQVREPVHDRALDVWKNYRDELAPIAGFLQEAGILPEVGPA